MVEQSHSGAERWISWTDSLPFSGEEGRPRVRGIVDAPDGQEGFYIKTRGGGFTFKPLGEGQNPGDLLHAMTEQDDLVRVCSSDPEKSRASYNELKRLENTIHTLGLPKIKSSENQ